MTSATHGQNVLQAEETLKPMAKRGLDNAPQVQIESRKELRDWLSANADTGSGAWIVAFKKAEPERYLPLSDVVDEALCFGWIDSLPRAKDAARTMLYISPRKSGSNRSRVNKDKVERLIAEGRMTSMGLAVISRSKEDGSWTALDDVDNLVIPKDLQTRFDQSPPSQTNWDAFPRSVKRGALEILLNAKRPATRAAKITEITDCA
jgi:uncharacterized protein YdeI (YjbR/CyaY-like superfamily)